MKLQASGNDAAAEVELEYKRNYVRKQLAVSLTKYVGEIMATSVDVAWPTLPGSHMTPSTPALEFVKDVIQVFSLDPDVANETSILKKSALTQMGMHEYSEESRWLDPCASFVLPNVFCDACDTCTNLNLCVQQEKAGDWVCADCGTAFDKSFIEWRLVEMMNKKSVQFQVQDLRCPKTNAVATGLMSTTNGKGVEYVGDFDRPAFIRDLGVLKRVAGAYDLPWLGETVEGLLE